MSLRSRRLVHLTVFLLASGVVAASGPRVLAQSLSQVAQLAPHPDGLPGDPGAAFGRALAIEGDTAVVGAPYDDSHPTDGGAVYVMTRSGATWTTQQKLLGDVGWFGFSVALSGDTLVVGAPTDSPGGLSTAGRAYVFVRSGTSWTLQQKLVAADAAAEGFFGYSVAISGQTVVIGAPTNNIVVSGATYVFVRSGTTWTQQQKLLSSDASGGDHFGTAVALSGETAVVGAPNKSASAGAVYAFVRSGTVWTQQQKLLASTGSAGDQLGTSVAVAGDTLVAGAISDDTSVASASGAAFVFVRNSGVWTEQQKLAGADVAMGDQLGVSVALAGDTALVGASYAHPPAGVEAGTAYVFVRAGAVWSQQQKLTAADGMSSDRFGQAVALAGDTAIVGAPMDAAAIFGQRSGAAHVYTRAGTTWSAQQKLLGVDNAGFDLFGIALAFDGDTVAVGATLDRLAARTGSASVFVRSGEGWLEQQKVMGSDVRGSDLFGSRIALSGDTLAVAATEHDEPGAEDAGAVYVFVRSGGIWTQQQKLTASDGATEDYFGKSLALSGDTLAVGSRAAGSSGSGAVYVFVRSGATWTLQQKLTVAGAAAIERFGECVALSGDTLAVGMPADDAPGGTQAGSVRIFQRTGTVWSAGPVLTSSDYPSGDWFGDSVALVGDTLAVGAPFRFTAAGAYVGSAYVFERSAGGAWLETQKFELADGASSDYFGNSIALHDDLVVVGAPGRDTPAGVDAGAAYAYARSGGGWAPKGRLVARAGAAADGFGRAVGVQGGTVVVGAPGVDFPDAGSAGSAYVFEPVVKGDLDRDLRTDLLFRNNPSAFHELWTMNGTAQIAAQRIVPDLADPAWQVAGVDDFDADGRNDLVLWNGVTGAVEFWLMNGAQRLGAAVPLSGASPLSPDWKLAATGDFNADGNPDLVWRNVSSQQIVIWRMAGTVNVGSIVPSPSQAVDGNWEIVAALDWNGDGARDFLWYNRDSGKIVQWLMNASVGRIAGRFTSPPNAGDSNWKVLAGGDYGAGAGGLAGTNDVVWRNATSGRVVVWHLDLAGTRTAGTFTTPDAPSPNPLDWTVAGPR